MNRTCQYFVGNFSFVGKFSCPMFQTDSKEETKVFIANTNRLHVPPQPQPVRSDSRISCRQVPPPNLPPQPGSPWLGQTHPITRVSHAPCQSPPWPQPTEGGRRPLHRTEARCQSAVAPRFRPVYVYTRFPIQPPQATQDRAAGKISSRDSAGITHITVQNSRRQTSHRPEIQCSSTVQER